MIDNLGIKFAQLVEGISTEDYFQVILAEEHLEKLGQPEDPDPCWQLVDQLLD